MKVRLSFIVLAILGLVLTSQGDEVLGQDTTFFAFPPYRLSQPLQPIDGWVRFDSLVTTSSPDSIYDPVFVGTADMETPVYQNLNRGLLYETLMQRPFNRDFAAARAEAALARAGRGEIRTKVVQRKEDRGLYVIAVRYERPTSPQPIDFYLSPKETSLFVSETRMVEAFLVFSTGMVPVKANAVEFYLIGDTTVASIDSGGRVMALKPGTVTIKGIYRQSTLVATIGQGSDTIDDTLHAEMVVYIQPMPEAPMPVMAKKPTRLFIGGHLSRFSRDGEVETLTGWSQPTYGGLDLELQIRFGLSLLLNSDWSRQPSVYTAGLGLPITLLGDFVAFRPVFTPFIGIQLVDSDPKFTIGGSLRIPIYDRLSFRLMGSLVRWSKEYPSQLDYTLQNTDGQLKYDWQYTPAWKEKWWDGAVIAGFSFQLTGVNNQKRRKYQ